MTKDVISKATCATFTAHYVSISQRYTIHLQSLTIAISNFPSKQQTNIQERKNICTYTYGFNARCI